MVNILLLNYKHKYTSIDTPLYHAPIVPSPTIYRDGSKKVHLFTFTQPLCIPLAIYYTFFMCFKCPNA